MADNRLPKAALAALGFPPDAKPLMYVAPVASLETPKGKVWVKTIGPSGKNPWIGMLNLIARIIPFPILRPSKGGKSGETLLHQVKQAQVLRDAGFQTADILYWDHDMLILADAGITLDRAARDLESGGVVAAGLHRDAMRSALLRVTGILSRLHSEGLAHGRPKMRDFTWRRGKGDPEEGVVTILDLEERPWDVMPMAAAQARDVFLWIGDLTMRPLSREVAADAFRLYSREMKPDVAAELRKLLRLLAISAPLVRLIERTPLHNRETAAGLAAYKVLKAGLSK